LGNGDSRQKFQTFKLPKSPLTYHAVSTQTPPETPELKIYVDGRLWKRISSFFTSKPDDEVYIVREDHDGVSWVQFGDGKTGKRLPSGLNNVVAEYRTGNAAYGALKTDTTAQAGSKLDNLDKILLPGLVTGGDTAEKGDTAREAAPGKVQSLDRLVSLKDYESEALAIAGVSKAAAAWELVEGVPSVVITVLMDSGRSGELASVRKTLNEYNRCRGAQRFPIEVIQGQREYIAIIADVAFDPTYQQTDIELDIKESLGLAGEEKSGIDGSDGLLAEKNRNFGAPEYASRIAAAIQNVDGVLWADVKGLQSLGVSDAPKNLILPTTTTFSATLACGSDRILALYSGLLKLSPVSAPAMEAC
jgi:predicted phage baseplate assembly protein